MAALDFPTSPSVGQRYPASPVAGQPQYSWDGEKWMAQGKVTSELPATVLPLMNATPAVVGVSTKYAREDHVHPTDASLMTPAEVMAAVLAANINAVRISTFQANGTYTPHADMIFCMVEIQGGGGGGGGGNAIASWASSGGGGGSGAYVRSFFTKAEMGGGQAIVIGLGGAQGNTGNGGGGGTTTFGGALMQASGGSGGGASSGKAGGNPGVGGGSTTGQLGLPGNNGFPGNGVPTSQICFSSRGADSRFGQGGIGQLSGGALTGVSGQLGGGGGGGLSVHTALAAGGGGGSGLVVVTEYCSA